MAKTTLATIAILSVLLLSLGIISAATVDNFILTVDGEGSSSNRLTGANESSHSVIINIDHQNNTIGEVYVNWSVAASNSDIMDLPEGKNFSIGDDIEVEGFDFTMPYRKSGYIFVTANIHSLDKETFHGTKAVGVYFNNTDYIESTEEIPGCMDPEANNYDPDATVDDGSCENDPTPTGDSWCTDDFDGEIGTIEIKNFYIDYIGNGDDEEWEALDEIIIEVDVKNTDSDDSVDDIMVEIKILDSSNVDVTSDFDFEDEEKSLGRISKKSTETAIFTITELPTDVEEDTYQIYVIAYDENEGEAQCASTSDDFNDEDELFHEFEVVRESEAVIVKESDLLLGTILTSCGEKGIEVSFPVYNLGDDEEDKVLVQLHNSELGIDEFYVIDSLRSGKGKTATFFIDLPEELSKTRYSLDIITFFAYDDDEDELDRTAYDENSNDIDRDFSIRLEILSCQAPEATIQIDLESETIVGKQVVIKATITNNGEDNDFIISTSGLDSWAESINIVPLTTSIDEGESEEVIITFIPTSEGEHSFEVITISDGQTNSKSAIINIKEKPSIFSGISNAIVYTILIVAAVLILIILALIVKVSRRQPKPQF